METNEETLEFVKKITTERFGNWKKTVDFLNGVPILCGYFYVDRDSLKIRIETSPHIFNGNKLNFAGKKYDEKELFNIFIKQLEDYAKSFNIK